MKKRNCKRALSFLLVLAMVMGMIPTFVRPVEAASNIAGTFQGQDADIFSALGFDTSEVPEGYDAETTDNPYGRDKLPGNQVFELLVSGTNGTRRFGHNNNDVNVSDISGAPSSGTTSSLVMSAVAAGDFDGDGLAGEVVYVGYTDIAYNTYSVKADLYMCVYDAADGVYSGLKKIGSFNPAQVTTSGGTNYSCYDYAWQNLLQVTAGDYDGDGISEIAAYVADDGNARVDIFKFQKTSESTDTSWRDIDQWSRTWSHVLSNTANKIPNMVSLTSGDFDRDGVDDLAISTGRFAPGNGNFTQLQMDKSTAVVLWGARSDMLQSYEALNLDEGTLGQQVRVSLIAGDLDNDGYAELIATGQPMSDAQNYKFSNAVGNENSGHTTEGNTSRTIITYIYDEAMGLTIQYSGMHKPIDGSWVTVGEGDGASTNWQSNNGFDDKYYSQPVMRTNAAVIYPEGADYSYLYLDSCLYEWAEGQVSLKHALDDDAAELSGSGRWGALCEDMQQNIDANYAEYSAASGDMNGNGRDVLATAFYRSDSTEKEIWSNGAVTETSRMHVAGYMVLGGDSEGSLTSKINHTNQYTGLSGEEKLNAVALAMVDTDLDTVLIEYTGQHYLIYSDPKVYAVIAAAPYFEDVDKICGYDYAWQNTTSYSILEGSGKSDIVGVDLEAGAWLSADVVAGGGKVITELGLMYTLEWEKETSHNTEYALTFETSQDEDSVAFFSIPTENYLYKISTPDGNGGYIEHYETISRPFTPCYQILTLDYYESIQGNYEELPQISGTVLTSTPGDPSSYPSSTSGYDVLVEWNDDPAGVSFGSGAITQEITVTDEKSESYNMGVALDYKLGYGGEFQSDLVQSNVEMAGGGQFSLNPTGGWATFNMEGASYSGTVTNMPLEFQDYGYYYTWKLFAYAYNFGGETIPVVSYVVGDISEPPTLPEDFQQDYDRTTSDTNVLTWTYDDEFSSFKINKYYDFPVGGGLQEILEISKGCAAKTTISNSTGTYNYGYTLKYDDDGKMYKEYYFEDCNLAPYTEYEYSIQVERLSKVPPRSAPSELVAVRTKAAEGNPLIPISESDGENDGKLLVYPDKTSYLTVEVAGPKGETASSYYTTVQYQWQKRERGAWVDMTGETGKTLTFAQAGVDTAGKYRCLVNVLTQSDNTAISTYTDSVELTHAKRISYIDEQTFSVQDVSGGGVYIYAQVRNAHGDSAAIPSGTVTFNLTNNATGQNYQFTDELNAEGVAEVNADYTLPEGMYTAEAYYSGSFNFTSCTAQTMYLSQWGSGYDVDAPISVVYGEGAQVIGRAVSKTAGITSTVEEQAKSFQILPAAAMSLKELDGALAVSDAQLVQKGHNYVYDDDGLKYYFRAEHSTTVRFKNGYVLYEDGNDYLSYTNDGGKYEVAKNTPAGLYMICMTFGEGVDAQSANATITILRREITLQLPKMKGDEGKAAVANILVSELDVVSGGWADCDMDDSVLTGNLATTVANLNYYNTAGTKIATANVGNLCGYYTTKSTSSITNYSVIFRDGAYTVLGGTNNLSVGARYFEGKDVGTVYVVSPEYAYSRVSLNDNTETSLDQKHATGTRLVFTAVPDEGYTIYAWYINGIKQNTTATSINYTMLNEETTVEVQFDVKKNTLSFGTAGDADGGTIICSDATLTSGSVVLPNAYMIFDAVAKEGYHFKEWRYTELGSGTVYDDTDSGKMESSFELLMPSAGCSVYAVFERDFFTLNYSDDNGNNGLTAWYTQYQPGATEGETVYVESGTSIKGDTVITVGLKPGYLWDEEYNFVVDGSQGVANYDEGTYIFSLTEDTTVYGNTVRDAYDLTLAFDVEEKSAQAVDAKIIYTVDGKEDTFTYEKTDPSVTLENIPGGSKIIAQIIYPSYYLLDGWTAAVTKLTASTQQNKLATNVAFGGEVAEGGAYWYTAESGGSKTNYYFVSPVDGTVEYEAEAVTIYAAGTSYVIDHLSAEDTLTVHLTEKDIHKVTVENIDGYGTYSFTLPEGTYQEGDDICVHNGDDFDVLITPKTGWTVTYWNIKPTTSPEQEVKATSLRYIIPDVDEDFHLTPIFAATTYNTISWPTISQEQNNLTLSEYNCVASVVSGNSFSFVLSGAGLELLDKVYANGHEFLPAADGGDYTYTGTGANRIYTISNIRQNYEITVGFKNIGVTVNGVDISTLRGVGWTYDAPSQKLIITNSNLTLSGKNNVNVAPKLSIWVEAESVALSDLQLQSAAEYTFEAGVLNLAAAETVLTVTGTNKLGCSDEAFAVIASHAEALTLRGTGSLTIGGTASPLIGFLANNNMRIVGRCTLNFAENSGTQNSLYVRNDLTVVDTATVNVNATANSSGKAVNVFNLTVGTENGSDNPVVRVNGGHTGVYIANDLVTYTGELAISAENTALQTKGSIYTYGGVVELTAANILGNGTMGNEWQIHYDNGYSLRSMPDEHATVMTDPKSVAEYSSGTYDVLTWVEGNKWFQENDENFGDYHYVRLTPLPKTGIGDLTLSVDVGGKTYSAKVVMATYNENNFARGYYYTVDGSNVLNFITESDFTENRAFSSDPNYTLVAFCDGIDLRLCGYTYTFVPKDPADEWSMEHIEVNGENGDVQYCYTISGNYNGINGIIAESAYAAGLTLDNVVIRSIEADGVPVYLVGDNLISDFLSVGDRTANGYHLELYSIDGTGSLRISGPHTAISGVYEQQSDGTNQPCPLDVLLVNVKIFEVSADNSVVSTQKEMVITYHDSEGKEIPYGRGWKLNAGANSATSTQLTGNEVGGNMAYMCFYRNTEEAEITPATVTFDKTRGTDNVSGLENADLAVFEPIEDGQIRRFDKEEQADRQDDTTGYVVLLDTNGNQTQWTAGNQYTWTHSSDLSQPNTLSISQDVLSQLELGKYTLRIFFYDESSSDATYYYSDVALTVTDVDRISGSLSAEPQTYVMGRGDSVTLTTSYTGTTVMGYTWTVEGNTSVDTVVNANGDTATLTIGSDEAITGDAPIVITVTSYADTAKTTQLDWAKIQIAVVPVAESIVITCEGETPSGDDSYTLHHTTDDNVAKTWNFRADVTMDDGEADPAKVSWSLWGNRLKATTIDSATGVLTVAPKETGMSGMMKITATYENEDGSTFSKTIDIWLSSNVWVGIDNTGAVNGTITGYFYDEELTSGAYVPVGTAIVVQAEPNEGYAVRNWYVNGISVMDAAGYTVDEENHTLSFTAAAGGRYVISADYINENAVVITYSAEGPGSVSAAVDGTVIASGTEVLVESSVTFTAIADNNCVVKAWYVDDVLQEGYTASTLTLENLAEDHTVRVVFEAPQRTITVTTTEGGSVAATLNGQPLEGSVLTVTTLDSVLINAVALEGYRFVGWSEGVTATGSNACLVLPGMENITVTATFEKIPIHTVTIYTNSYENGSGTVTAGDKTVDMASSDIVEVLEGENLTICANVDVGCYLYSWTVEGAQYTQNGDTITLQNVEGNVTVTAKFRREKFDVTLSVNGSGIVDTAYSLTVLDNSFDGSLADSNELWGGTKIEMVMTPYTDGKLESLTVNGEQAQTVYDVLTNTYTFAVEALTKDLDIVVTFITLPTYAVKIPTQFTDIVEVPVEPEPVYEEKVMGTLDVGFVEDGISGDGDSDEENHTKTVRIAHGGTAVITVESAEGYELDWEKLCQQIGQLLADAESSATAEYAITESGGQVTLSNVDKPLDLTGMEAPFVEQTETVLYTVTLPAATTGGSLVVKMGDVVIENGAKVPENTQLSVNATADAHYKQESLTANGEAVTGTYTVTGDVTFSVSFQINHSYESVVTAPTCTEGGYTTYICSCGEFYVADTTEALDHSFTNYISDNNATIESDGTKTAKCDRCDATDTVIDEGSRLSIPDRITSDVLTVADGVIRTIPVGTTVAELIEDINEREYIRVFKGDEEVFGDTLVGTGMIVKLMFGSTVKDSVVAVVTGDLNGDGKASITDMLNIKSVLLGKLELDRYAAMAADLTGEGKITITDFVQIKAYVLGKGNITAR